MLKKILLADDSLTIQKVVELTFTEEDYEVVVVGDGAQAIQRIGQDSPDIVLADVLMPKKTGYEVCEHVKGNPATRHVPVLLLVGKFEPFDEERAKKAGADGHILKPFESAVLVRRVTELIAQATRSAPARGASGTEVTAHVTPPAAAAAAPAPAPFEPTPAPAAEPFGAVEPFAPSSGVGASWGALETESIPPAGRSDTAQFERELPPLAPAPRSSGLGAAPFVEEAQPPFEDSPKSLLDADDEAPVLPSAYEAAPFGDEPAPLAVEPSAAPLAASWEPVSAPPAAVEPAELAEPSFVTPAPVATSAPAWEEPAAAEAPSARAMVGAAAAELGISSAALGDDAVNAIVERVVRKLSEEIVKDIAWQVVPDLAELMIKKKLEELG